MQQVTSQRSGPLRDAQLRDYLTVLVQRRWYVIVTAAVFFIVVLFWGLLSTPMYTAKAILLRQSTTFDEALLGSSVFRIADPARDLQTGSDLVKLDAVGAMVKKQLGSDMSAEELVKAVDVRPSGTTDLIEIAATDSSPEQAAAIANAFATQFIAFRTAADKAILAKAQQQIQQELASMTAAQRESQRGVVLGQTSYQLSVLESMQTGGYEVAQQASVPLESSSPRIVRNSALALAAGLIIGIIIAFAVNQLDRRIKDSEALETEFDSPVLARIPFVGRKWLNRNGTATNGLVAFGDPRSPLLEPYRLLRANLKYFGVEKDLRTILVTSGLAEEGKSVTTANLALGLAFSGSRVIVLEADLRRPNLHNLFDLDNSRGLSNLLVEGSSLTEVAQTVRLDEFVDQSNGDDWAANKLGKAAANARRNLLCVTSGPIPPNPAELLESKQMTDLIATAADAADYVLIDTPPALVVVDALSLSTKVDAVIVSTRINRTTYDEARLLKSLLARSGANVIGVVAQGVKRRRGDARSYAYYTTHT